MTQDDAVPMLVHFQALLDMKEQQYLLMMARIEAILAEREKQLENTAKALDLHLSNLNRYKEEAQKKDSLYLTKESYETKHEILVNTVADVKGSLRILIPLSATIGGVIGAFISHFFK